ncbi:translation initiation factor eIF4e [Teratosphaeria nubilosa]|uniref:Translation initiation factor eIF4e n=1 Tax=Teratosphaeria nubilosa TaxID=161662 RepID=A0A6G1L427_9PEZI|nr:translation initiation factor eIF4e [Teratosphaeria nubilosa]
MASLPTLRVSGLPALSSDEAKDTTSPARGAEMRNFLQARLQKNRAPPLVHSWDFYHDRQDRTRHNNLSNINAPSTAKSEDGQKEDDDYASRLEHLAVIDDVRKFWNVFNNFDLSQLALRDSVHLFHKGVKPIWEDPRNARGGSWTFRVPKEKAQEFWKEVCMMAIGEQLQAAVEDDSRVRFRDDICGVSIGVRFNSMLVQVWNRDGEHTEGIERICETTIENLSEELKPREGSFYYKKHSEHAGFAAPADGAHGSERLENSATASAGAGEGGAGIDAVVAGHASS